MPRTRLILEYGYDSLDRITTGANAASTRLDVRRRWAGRLNGAPWPYYSGFS